MKITPERYQQVVDALDALPRATTYQDVARAAGVAPSVVSRFRRSGGLVGSARSVAAIAAALIDMGLLEQEARDEND